MRDRDLAALVAAQLRAVEYLDDGEIVSDRAVGTGDFRISLVGSGTLPQA